MTTRRGFLAAMLAASAAPAIVRAASLMPIWTPQSISPFVGFIDDIRITKGIARYSDGVSECIPRIDAPFNDGDWTLEGWLGLGLKPDVWSSVKVTRQDGKISRFLDGQVIRHYPPGLLPGLREVGNIAMPYIGRVPI